ncbi:MAG: hypothetical protein ACM65K_19555 [Microcoleus sp.]
MEAASIENIDFGDGDDNVAVVVECESIHESIHQENESIHQWVSSAEAKHRLRVKNQAEFVRAISLNLLMTTISLSQFCDVAERETPNTLNLRSPWLVRSRTRRLLTS